MMMPEEDSPLYERNYIEYKSARKIIVTKEYIGYGLWDVEYSLSNRVNLSFLGWFEKRETSFDAASKIYHSREDAAMKDKTSPEAWTTVGVEPTP